MMIWYYNNQALKPTDLPENTFNELIHRNYIDDFFQVALPALQNSEYKISIENAINTLMIRKDTVIELAYISYFQALEAMILTFKRSRDLEFIFPKNEFAKLRKKLEKEISNIYPNDESIDQRARLKSKLPELNRVSLKETAEEFFEAINIDTSFTWPLFDDKSKGVTGLASIRNILVHGDLLPSDKLESIAIASEHLRVLVLRCVFKLLDWDCEKTNIGTQHLQKSHFLFRNEIIDEAIKDIHSYLQSKTN